PHRLRRRGPRRRLPPHAPERRGPRRGALRRERRDRGRRADPGPAPGPRRRLQDRPRRAHGPEPPRRVHAPRDRTRRLLPHHPLRERPRRGDGRSRAPGAGGRRRRAVRGLRRAVPVAARARAPPPPRRARPRRPPRARAAGLARPNARRRMTRALLALLLFTVPAGAREGREGNARFADGRVEDAAGRYRAGLDRSTAPAGAVPSGLLNNLGSALFEQEEFAEAQAAFESALAAAVEAEDRARAAYNAGNA